MLRYNDSHLIEPIIENMLIHLPIKSTAFSCFAIISIRYNVLVLSTLGTRIVWYSKMRSGGYSNSDTILLQCIHFPSSDTRYSKIVSSSYRIFISRKRSRMLYCFSKLKIIYHKIISYELYNLAIYNLIRDLQDILATRVARRAPIQHQGST